MIFPEVNQDWTLFLDRDGVINVRKMGGYIETIEEFEFLPGVLEAISEFSKIFKHIFIVTNQQGIGKGIMDELDLGMVHEYMLHGIQKAGGRIDKVYFCPGLAKDKPFCRKPQIGMAILAKSDFPDVDFTKSLMIGDSLSDIQFAHHAGMQAIYIRHMDEVPKELPLGTPVYNSLGAFAFGV